MQRHSFHRIIFLIAVLVTLLLPSCASQPSRQMTALIAMGNAEILPGGETEWQALNHKTIIHTGDSIRTGDDTWVYLEIDDGSLVGLTPNTKATLVTFSESAKNPVTLFDLADGLVYVRVTKALGKGSFKIHTPVFTGSVVGSQMSVIYIQSSNVAGVTCFEGNVDAEISYDAEAGMTACHLISGVKLSPSSPDEWTVKKCEHPVVVNREETQAYSDWEKMYIDLEYLRQTEAARFATMTRQARNTRTPTPTEIIYPTDTPLPSQTATITRTPTAIRRASVTINPEAKLSEEEEANNGIHNYTFTATYSSSCSGPASGRIDQMQIQFEGNKVILSAGGNRTEFDKVDENTYQGIDGDDLVVMTFTMDGFTGESQCGNWVYTRE